MLFSKLLCPVCKTHTLGSQSTSRRAKNSFKTCGSKECAQNLRYANPKSGHTFTRTVSVYSGPELCCCGSQANYQFKSGKLCCQNVATNCPSVRIDINTRITQKLKTETDSNGLTGTQRKALKGADTKRNDLDELGKNGWERFSDKLKDTIENSRDNDGRTYQSRAKLSHDDFLLKPEKEKYYSAVWTVTEQQYREHFYKIDNAEQRGSEYHLDHIFSISEGFKQKIPAEVIANYTNLRVISSTLNCSKRAECHKTLTELYEDFALARTSANEISL